MRRLFLCAAALIALGATLCPSTARPQEATKQSKESQKPTSPPNFYRVDYTIRELDHGKRTNTRNYTLKVEAGRGASFRVGSRIPVATGHAPGSVPGDVLKPEFQYHDVGVGMDCTLREHADYVWLGTKADLNSVAGSDSGSVASPPVIRSFRFEDTTVAPLGKSTLVGGIDDVFSDHRYEIEVTVTKIP